MPPRWVSWTMFGVMMTLAAGCLVLAIVASPWCLLGAGLFGYASDFYREQACSP